MRRSPRNDQNAEDPPAEAEKPMCGIIMPISLMEGYPASHWSDVRAIITAAALEAGFEARMVSEASYTGVIQKRILQNLYSDPMVICDVSGYNPNVMFELGIRLTFDKPTIVIKDNDTRFIFDTSPLEHIEYRKDLRYADIVKFQQDLSLKVKQTHERNKADPNYSTFLKHFGTFTVPTLETKEVSGQEFILEELKEIRGTLRRLGQDSRRLTWRAANWEGDRDRELRRVTGSNLEKITIAIGDREHAQKIIECLNMEQDIKVADFILNDNALTLYLHLKGSLNDPQTREQVMQALDLARELARQVE